MEKEANKIKAVELMFREACSPRNPVLTGRMRDSPEELFKLVDEIQKDSNKTFDLKKDLWFLDLAQRTTTSINEEGRAIVLQRFGIQNVGL